MSNIFFTSDQHYGHSNIIKHCNRPFQTSEEMDEVMIENFNKVVTKKDVTYIVGDLTLGGAEFAAKILQRLNGCKIWLLGNHDPKINALGKIPAVQVYTGLLELREPRYGVGLVLCHYPFESWNKAYHGSYHLHGHTHGNLKSEGIRRLDVGVDCWNYSPVVWETLKEKMDLIPPQNVKTSRKIVE